MMIPTTTAPPALCAVVSGKAIECADLYFPWPPKGGFTPEQKSHAAINTTGSLAIIFVDSDMKIQTITVEKREDEKEIIVPVSLAPDGCSLSRDGVDILHVRNKDWCPH